MGFMRLYDVLCMKPSIPKKLEKKTEKTKTCKICQEWPITASQLVLDPNAIEEAASLMHLRVWEYYYEYYEYCEYCEYCEYAPQTHCARAQCNRANTSALQAPP